MAEVPNSKTALMTVKGSDGPPSLPEAAAQLGLEVEAIDADYGVVMVSPDRGLYAVLVDASQLAGGFEDEKGPFSNPPIAPMRSEE